MNPLAALTVYLSGFPEVASQVAVDQVTSRPTPHTELPLLVVEPLPGRPRQTIQQGYPVNEPRFRIHCIAGQTTETEVDAGNPVALAAGRPDFDRAVRLADAVRRALEQAPGQTSEGLRIDRAAIEAEQLMEDDDTHNARQVFRVALSVREV